MTRGFTKDSNTGTKQSSGKFFINNLFDEFIPLAGDRYYSEDKSVIAGFAKFENKSVLFIGQ